MTTTENGHHARNWYTSIKPEDLVRVQPPGYRLAVLRIPFSRKFRITWWLDANGRIARRATR